MKASYLYILLIIIPTHTLQSESPTTQEKPQVNFDEAAFNWSRTLAESLQAVSKKHYMVNDPTQCWVSAINGFLSCLDPHSALLDPKTYKMMLESTSGEFFGIGIVIDNTRQTKDKFLMIVDTIPEGPADKAGVKPFDKIVEIEGKPLEGMSTEEATSMLRGEKNSKVHIKIMRENHPDIIALDITRGEIKEQTTTSFFIPEFNVYYISLNIFSETSGPNIEKLLQILKKKEYKALILDLRNNSGGLLTSAIDIAGLFLDKGSQVVSTKGKDNKETERYATTRHPVINSTTPIFILINNYTASAAEILAGCLKLHSQAFSKKNNKEQKKLMVFLVGSRSFGKGSVQEVIPVSNNCAIKITTSLYFLPFDTSIQGLGIEPDFVVEKKFPPTEQLVWFNKFYGQEKALPNYINPTGTKKEEEKKSTSQEKSWLDRTKEMLEKDNQLRETLTLINFFDTAKHCCPQQVNNRQKAIDFIKKNYVAEQPLNLEEVKL